VQERAATSDGRISPDHHRRRRRRQGRRDLAGRRALVLATLREGGTRAVCRRGRRCLQSRARARRHQDRRRDAPHAPTHGSEPDDRRGLRRLHHDGDLGALVDAHAGAYTHPTERKIGALDLPGVGRIRAESNDAASQDLDTASEIKKSLKEIGGRREDRTPDLLVANATRATRHSTETKLHRARKVRWCAH
jgi:hypothetical protein